MKLNRVLATLAFLMRFKESKVKPSSPLSTPATFLGLIALTIAM